MSWYVVLYVAFASLFSNSISSGVFPLIYFCYIYMHQRNCLTLYNLADFLFINWKVINSLFLLILLISLKKVYIQNMEALPRWLSSFMGISHRRLFSQLLEKEEAKIYFEIKSIFHKCNLLKVEKVKNSLNFSDIFASVFATKISKETVFWPSCMG